jgi:hypothetical protein
VVKDILSIVGIRGQSHLWILQWIDFYVFVDYLPIYPYILEPFSSYIRQFALHLFL